jgi:hypothetical protein
MTEYEDLRREVAELRAQVAALSAPPVAAPVPEAEPEAEPEADGAVSRRGLFGKLAAVAAGGVGLAMLGSDEAAATTGTMVYGTSMNSGVDGTYLQGSTSPQKVFDVTQNGAGIAVGVDVTDTTSTQPALWVRHNGDGSVIDAAILKTGSTATAVTAYATNQGIGVEGQGGVGVRGVDTNGGLQGVLGESSQGKGVYGYSSSTGSGVYGYSNTGKALEGYSNGTYGAWLHGASAPLFLDPAGSAGHPTSGTHSKGEVYVDSLGAHWVCIASGAPGTWVRPGFNPIGPARLVSSAVAAGSFVATQRKDFLVAGFGGIPAAASAVAVNLTARSTASGYLIVYPYGAGRPGISQLSFGPAYQWSGFAIVRLGTGKISVYNSAGNTKLSIDVAGFYA